MKRVFNKYSNEFSALALADVKQKFTTWRQASPVGRRRISEELWNEAVGLTAYFSMSAISGFLSLDFAGLKRRVLLSAAGITAIESTYKLPNKCSKVISSSSANNFKDSNPAFADRFIDITPYPCIDKPSSRLPVAEIKSENGMVLRLFSQDISEIIRAFTRS